MMTRRHRGASRQFFKGHSESQESFLEIVICDLNSETRESSHHALGVGDGRDVNNTRGLMHPWCIPDLALGSGSQSHLAQERMGLEKEAKARPQRASEPHESHHSATQVSYPIFHCCFQTKQQLVKNLMFWGMLGENGIHGPVRQQMPSQTHMAHNQEYFPSCTQVCLTGACDFLQLQQHRNFLYPFFSAGFQIEFYGF